MNRIGVFTSGGDSPGMNACTRAVVRSALAQGVEVFGIESGYKGMIEGRIAKLDRSSVSGIIGRGGTVLGTARSKEFMDPEGRKAAVEALRKYGIEGIVACGGDGTFRGAAAMIEEYGIAVVGTPGTIDNDLYGTDYTIGYDTAVNTALELVDKLRDTAESHDRTFFVEVMGRHAGFIALDVGLAGGAEYVAVPEEKTNFEELCRYMESHPEPRRHIFIVSEGDDFGGAEVFAERFKERFEVDTRVTILGHVQRGGSPTARDRILASRLGAAAVQALLDGKTNVMAGEVKGEVVFTPFKETWEKKAGISRELLELVDLLK